MKKIISSLIFFSIFLMAKNPYINRFNILDDVVNSLDSYTQFQEKVGLLRGLNDKTWINKNWIYTYRINAKAKIGIFRIEKVFSDTGKKQLGKYTFEQGTIFYYNGNYDNSSDRIVFLDKESKLGVETCLINSGYSKQMLISNPTCKEKWQNEIYLHNSNKIFQPKNSLIRTRMDEVMTAHDVVSTYSTALKELIANGTAIITAFKNEGKEVEVMRKYFYTRILDISIFLLQEGKVYNENSMEAIWIEGLSKTLADVIVTAITSGTNPMDGINTILSKSTDIIEITNNLNGAFDLDNLTEEMNELLVARAYLELYYKYGGKHKNGTDANGKVAQHYGGSLYSSLADTLKLVAEKGDYRLKNDWWGTEYNIPRVERIVEDIKNNIIPKVLNDCLTNECRHYYLKIDN